MTTQQIKKILLTGDDGYNSIGTRLVADSLKDQFELTIIGTTTQQSAVGAKMSLKTGFEWQKTSVDDIPAFAISGTPVDAMEFAAEYFPQAFDLVVSGVNWGANLGTSIASSGTLNAALRAVAAEVAPRGLAISWDLPPSFYLVDNHDDIDLSEYRQYPGGILKRLIELCCQQDFWGVELVNVNIPHQPTQTVELASMIKKPSDVYQYRQLKFKPDETAGAFQYSSVRTNKTDFAQRVDIAVVNEGNISITPCKLDIVHESAYTKYAGLKFEL